MTALKKNVEVCGCGHCDIYAERAIQYVVRSARDGECMIAMLAYVGALTHLVRHLFVSSADQKLGHTELLRMLPADLKQRMLRKLAEDHMTDLAQPIVDFMEENGEYWFKPIAEAVEKANQRRRDEAKLQKGN